MPTTLHTIVAPFISFLSPTLLNPQKPRTLVDLALLFLAPPAPFQSEPNHLNLETVHPCSTLKQAGGVDAILCLRLPPCLFLHCALTLAIATLPHRTRRLNQTTARNEMKTMDKHEST